MRRTAWLTLVVLLLLGAACGGGDDPTVPSSPTATGTTEPTETEEACEDQTGDEQIELEMKDNVFEPECLTVRGSQPIHIENNGAALHSFTIAGTQVDVDVQPGEEGNFEAADLEPGNYLFRCKYHPPMTGSITVE